MSTAVVRMPRPAYERAGEYRRPSIRMRPLTAEERAAILAACTVPQHRWTEAVLQRMPEPPGRVVLVSAEQWSARRHGQLCEQRRPVTEAAPPAVLTPIAAEDNPAPAVPRAESIISKTPLSDLAQATLERYRKRYCL